MPLKTNRYHHDKGEVHWGACIQLQYPGSKASDLE